MSITKLPCPDRNSVTLDLEFNKLSITLAALIVDCERADTNRVNADGITTASAEAQLKEVEDNHHHYILGRHQVLL
ncbi:hypothetical protein Y032_0382g366 [Ancylostoma ceylanicum]|uniref:Uncharacterized protein n=1 Tax=Ancylostoma ceylanicum TaxID=53326 RepID=A0A016RT43_9BILA|nr:hypothetical protein Y032_0382g366 [Ancylostoma ceylanicum]